MNERMKILEMLQEGKINVEEAMGLLKQFPEAETPPAAAPHVYTIDPRQINPNKKHKREDYDPDEQEHHEDHEDFENGPQIFGNFPRPLRAMRPMRPLPPIPPMGWVGNIANWAKNLAQNIGDEIREGMHDIDVDIDLPEIFMGNVVAGKSTKFAFKSDPLNGNAIESVKLLAKNAPIKIDEHDEDFVLIEGNYSARKPEAKLIYEDKDGHHQLLYDYDMMRHVRITCYLPRVACDLIHAETKNAPIDVDDLKNIGKMVLETKNAAIAIDDISEIGQLSAITRNGGIALDGVHAGQMDITTSNAKISLDDTSAENATLKTSNGRISVEDIDIANLQMHTSNAPIAIEDIGAENWQGERTLAAYTSNGSVQIELPSNIGLDITAETSRMSNVDCEVSGKMILGAMSKNQLSCKSADFDQFPRRLHLKLATTNGTVKIRED
ncbi:MAG: DUF4097 family beta strand repeat-containing protein [Defluviitaleaceae bacterium]|nr:DUF4097 family beta strand repeat-containing protein [Defluviitaleaceae bacterium]